MTSLSELGTELSIATEKYLASKIHFRDIDSKQAKIEFPFRNDLNQTVKFYVIKGNGVLTITDKGLTVDSLVVHGNLGINTLSKLVDRIDQYVKFPIFFNSDRILTSQAIDDHDLDVNGFINEYLRIILILITLNGKE